ncbi:MAG TPA: hypothetical protein VIH61_10215 [Waddliaceae bacterium]
MKNYSKYFNTFLLILMLGLSVHCFAVQNCGVSHDESRMTDNYYVQPGGVYVAPNGIFAMLDGHLVQVNMLCSDEKGVFIPEAEMTRQFVRCPFCWNWYDPDGPPHDCPGPA